MPRDCWPSLCLSWQNITLDSILRGLALIYLPMVGLVSLFGVLTWLGHSMNSGTLRVKGLIVVITYFGAILVLECILLVHVAIRRQTTARLTSKPSCVEASTQATSSSFATDHVASPEHASPPTTDNQDRTQIQPGHQVLRVSPATPTAENLHRIQSPPRPQVISERPQEPVAHAENLAHIQSRSTPKIFRALRAQGDAERPQEPVLQTEEPTPSTSSPHPTHILPYQLVPALCEPYISSPTTETTRPPTATTYKPQSSPPVLPPTPDLRTSWNLTMATNHHPSSTPPQSAPSQPSEARADPSAQPPAPTPTIPPERQPTPMIPEIAPLRIRTHISAVPSNPPRGSRSRPMYRATAIVEGGVSQQPQPQPRPHSRSPITQHGQFQPQPRPQSRTYSSRLQKDLTFLGGTR